MATWPQWTYAAILLFAFVYNLYGDGKKESMSGVIATLIVIAGQVTILYCGGFWSPWGIAP